MILKHPETRISRNPAEPRVKQIRTRFEAMQLLNGSELLAKPMKQKVTSPLLVMCLFLFLKDTQHLWGRESINTLINVVDYGVTKFLSPPKGNQRMNETPTLTMSVVMNDIFLMTACA